VRHRSSASPMPSSGDRRVPFPLLYGSGVVAAGIARFAGAVAAAWIGYAYLGPPV